MIFKSNEALPYKKINIAIGIIGVFIILMVSYSLYSCSKLEKISSQMVDDILEIEFVVSKAHFEFDRGVRVEANNLFVNMCWENLDKVENHVYSLLHDEEGTLSADATLFDLEIKRDLERIYENIIDCKNLTARQMAPTEEAPYNLEVRQAHDELFFIIIQDTDRVLRKVLLTSSNWFESFFTNHMLFVFIGLLYISLIVFLMYRFDKARRSDLDAVQDANINLGRQIIERIDAENGLRESERKLTTLISNLPGMVYRCKYDSKMSMEFISDGSLSITGYSSEEFMSNSITYYDIVHKEDKKNLLDQIGKAVVGKKTYQLVYRIITAPGFEKWVWEQGVGIYDDKKNPIALEGFIIDITEQRSAEEQLLLLSSALETADNGIMITDTEGSIVWVNSAFSKLTGYSSTEIFGQNARVLKSGKHSDEFYNNLWETIKAGNSWQGEMINQRKDGTYYTEEMTITPVRDSMNNITNFIGIKQDISLRKKSEKALRESEERFRGLYENATIGIYHISPDGKLLMANPQLVVMLGFETFEEVYFMNIWDSYVDPKSKKKYKSVLDDEGKIFGFEAAWRRRDRSIIHIRESARVVADENGVTQYYEGTVEDISESKKAEYALIEAKEKAEKSDKLKTEFLAQMSHEIRTPINALLSFSSLIREEVEDKVDDELKGSFDIIEIEGRRVIRTVDLILNMSQLQTESYSPSFVELDLYKDVLTKSFKDYKSQAENKKILFELAKNTKNTTVNVDDYSVRQIIDNLIDNALKYTVKGKVSITIFEPEKQKLAVSVSDTGVGISKEYLPIIFDPFTQEEHGYSRKFEGNGLGLALVKKFCELNNAEIEVEAKKGKGSVFTVIFDLPDKKKKA